MNLIRLIPIWLLVFAFLPALAAQNGPSAREIVERMDQKMRGNSSRGAMRMTIVRPSWSREVSMESWTLGDDYALILITAPAREKGMAFLKRGKEIWNWQPTIDRVVKLPPSMMMQSWMGSDFTNDDLVQQSSIVSDYEHQLLGEESIDGRPTYKVQLVPKPDAAVVWGKLFMWIDQQEFIELKTEFFDEDGYLINTMYGEDIGDLGGKVLARRMEMVPADEPGNKTVVEYLELAFEVPLEASFFSVQNMKRLRP